MYKIRYQGRKAPSSRAMGEAGVRIPTSFRLNGRVSGGARVGGRGIAIVKIASRNATAALGHSIPRLTPILHVPIPASYSPNCLTKPCLPTLSVGSAHSRLTMRVRLGKTLAGKRSWCCRTNRPSRSECKRRGKQISQTS